MGIRHAGTDKIKAPLVGAFLLEYASNVGYTFYHLFIINKRFCSTVFNIKITFYHVFLDKRFCRVCVFFVFKFENIDNIKFHLILIT
ncbi:hypothetical protein E5321_13720 [Escherichia coli]|nr:hypothetical protein [Escherichia coli]